MAATAGNTGTGTPPRSSRWPSAPSTCWSGSSASSSPVSTTSSRTTRARRCSLRDQRDAQRRPHPDRCRRAGAGPDAGRRPHLRLAARGRLRRRVRLRPVRHRPGLGLPQPQLRRTTSCTSPPRSSAWSSPCCRSAPAPRHPRLTPAAGRTGRQHPGAGSGLRRGPAARAVPAGPVRTPDATRGHVRRYLRAWTSPSPPRPRTSARRMWDFMREHVFPAEPVYDAVARRARPRQPRAPAGAGGAEGRGPQARPVEPLPPRARPGCPTSSTPRSPRSPAGRR